MSRSEPSQPDPRAPEATHDRPLVLIAEDEPIASMALRAQLEAIDCRVLGPARNGHEAVALGTCFPVDLALFDVRMPGRSGMDAALELFDLAPTPVVLLTGVDVADLPDPLPEPPIFELLAKPVGLPQLRNGIDAALERFRAWRQDHPGHGPDRSVTARAVRLLAQDQQPAATAVRLLQRARDEQRSAADVAHDILAEHSP